MVVAIVIDAAALGLLAWAFFNTTGREQLLLMGVATAVTLFSGPVAMRTVGVQDLSKAAAALTAEHIVPPVAETSRPDISIVLPLHPRNEIEDMFLQEVRGPLPGFLPPPPPRTPDAPAQIVIDAAGVTFPAWLQRRHGDREQTIRVPWDDVLRWTVDGDPTDHTVARVHRVDLRTGQPLELRRDFVMDEVALLDAVRGLGRTEIAVHDEVGVPAPRSFRIS